MTGDAAGLPAALVDGLAALGLVVVVDDDGCVAIDVDDGGPHGADAPN